MNNEGYNPKIMLRATFIALIAVLLLVLALVGVFAIAVSVGWI